MTQGIYGIHNTVSDKWYVGQSVNIEGRFRQHLYTIRGKGNATNLHLSAAGKKYGEAAFEYLVLEIVEDATILTEREEFWIHTKRNSSSGVYNMKVSADSCWGFKHSLETRSRMSAAKLGRPLSLETRVKLSVAHKGKKLSPAHCAALRGRKMSSANWNALQRANKGHTVSLETRAKISAAQTPAMRKRIAAVGRAARIFSPSDVEKIWRLRNLGCSYKKISTIMGCSAMTIWRILNKKTYSSISFEGSYNG
jgi:group I intron endonuclease